MKSLFLIPIAIFISTLQGADFTTYIGDQNQYQVAALATDSAGNTYVTGSRRSTNDVFVTKLDASGNIAFTTTFGQGADQAYAIAVDAAGSIWVGGSGSGGPGFLEKIASDGIVISSSSFGGVVMGIALDQGSNIYLTGITDSKDFPTTTGLPNDTGVLYTGGIGSVSGAFITKLDPTGSKIIYSAVIAGTAVDCAGGSTCFLSNRVTTGVGIGVDSAGDAFIAGNANVTDLPITTGAIAGYGAFAAEINAAGDKLVYLTYIGPPSGNIDILGPAQAITATGFAADSAGNAYLTGFTNDPLFPATPGTYQPKLNADLTQVYPNSNAFVVKLNPAGGVDWGTYLGGPANTGANAISLDGSGNVWLAGANGALLGTSIPTLTGATEDSLYELSFDGSKLLYSQNFPVGTAGQSLAVDSAGAVHFAGSVGLISSMTPGQTPAPHVFGIVNAAAGQISGRIAPGEVVSIYGYGVGPTVPAIATPVNGFFPTALGGVQVLLNGNAIPLLYVSATQINAEIPAPLQGAPDDSVILQVINGSITLPEFRAALDETIFGVFLHSGGSAAAINQDGTLNSAANPAKPGTIISIWATGFISPGSPINGAVAKAADNWCSTCQISVGTTTETVAYEGAAPGLIDGLMQINFMVPTQKGATQLQVFFNGNVYGFIYAAE